MGKILIQNQTAPATPGSGSTEIYVDSTTKKLKSKDDTGTITDYGTTGTGDVTGQASSIDGEITLFSGTTGKVIKRATGTGVVHATAGVFSTSSVVLTTEVTGTLPIANGGTGQTTANTAFNALAPSQTGNSGKFLTTNGTNTSWGTAGTIDPFSTMDIVDHFVTTGSATERVGSLGWALDVTGTASSSTPIDGEDRRPGIFRINAGTAATGRACIHLGNPGGLNSFKPNTTGQVITWKSRVRVTGAVLTFEMFVAGLGDVTAAVGDQTNGIYFQVLQTDLNWFLVSANGGTRTRLNTGTLFVSGVWHDFEFSYDFGAATITGKMDGVSFGTITTNLPANPIGPLYKADGITAGTAVNCDIDIFQTTITGATL